MSRRFSKVGPDLPVVVTLLAVVVVFEVVLAE